MDNLLLPGAPKQLKANLQNPETKVGHQLDREIKSAWEQKRQEKDQMRKMLNKKASVESQVCVSANLFCVCAVFNL